MTSSPPPGDRHPSDGAAIDRLLADVRAHLDRVQPGALASEMAAGALVVDIRPAADRASEGELPGAVVIERIHLEWRLDPSSEHRVPEADPGRRVIVVCNEGYASSLAADVLRGLGVPRATDVVGGYRAWRAETDPDGGGSDSRRQGLSG
jgi:rhodanese-related sulfurtransferase